jgi:hypothetical protein
MVCGSVAGTFEHGNEASGSIKGGGSADQYSYYQLLKKDSAPSSLSRFQIPFLDSNPVKYV